jgi:DNA-binding NarL/FixJ family response regulator
LRVVIAEDLTLLRDGLTRLLEAFDFEVVEAVDNGPALLPALLGHRPDVAIVDVRLPPTNTDEGLKAAIAARLFITEKVVSKYINNIFAKLDMPPSEDDNRRVLAVRMFLDG